MQGLFRHNEAGSLVYIDTPFACSGVVHYKYTLGDIAGCGWAPAVGGYQDGYLSAEKLINELIEHYGKEATLELLHEAVAFGI